MKIFSVTEINRIIKDLIDNEIILEDIMVTGELSSFSVTRNIAYFTLKDNENMLSCIQFGAVNQFKIGDMVQCRGNVKYYPKGGKLSFNVITVELCGQGELYQKFLEMKEKLEKEGLFDEKHKIPIPRFINSIGVVTSKTGAVLQDIKNVTSRRNPNLDIYVYDAQVQGKYAVNQVIEGISYFDNMTDVDVIVVARGGGSIEDLMPFNDEELARIAYICNKPLISAVGHETDFTILDFVADLRAPTPSAAAELVTFDNQELKRYIKDLQYTMQTEVENNFNKLSSNLDLQLNRIENQVTSVINDEYLLIQDYLNKLDAWIDKIYDNTTYSVNMSLATLDKLNPAKLLQTGYAYATANNLPIAYANVKIGDEIEVTSKDVKLNATITKKEKNNVGRKC
ncbi:MAG: exodeoxyribonuclease VII large subunit [Clostridia bacterium]|nr:exodeoxyribonuclease VII large subunit [Clostridia bacterium]